jgi:hypothetical protein
MEMDHTKLNPLFLLLNAQAWSSVIKDIKSDPLHAHGMVKMAGFYDKNISTTVNVLHIACKNKAPVEVIEALIEANEKTVSQTDYTSQQ